MHLLLPPSEGKSAPVSGPELDLSTLSWPALTKERSAVARELMKVSALASAREILGVGKTISDEVARQKDLWNLPCGPAREVYTGVLYEAAQLKPGDNVVIFSGLFGATTGEDLIPAYRLSMNVRLPRAGALKSVWRNALKGIDFLNDDAVVDMRSGSYQVWNPRGIWWETRITNSQGKVITHMAKHYRGLLTRALLDAKTHDVADVARTLGEVNVQRTGNRRLLTLIPAGL